MARNKYPENTVNKILKASLDLFLKKGYEQTTIQDIVDELGGMTKGAVYHHFRSKEDIIDNLMNHLFYKNNPFDKVKKEPGLTGLEKIRKVMTYSANDKEIQNLNGQALPMLENSRFLSELIQQNRDIVAPLMKELIEEGIQDGSIQTKYPKQLSEIVLMITNFWFIPALFPATKDEFMQKLYFVKDMTDKLGIPIFDEETIVTVSGPYLAYLSKTSAS